MGFAIIRSLATVGLLAGSCSSARVFAPRFFQAPPSGRGRRVGEQRCPLSA